MGRAWPGQSLRTIAMEHNATKSNHQPGDKYAVLVYDYQGQAGSNFRVYYDVQAGQHLYGGLVPCHE